MITLGYKTKFDSITRAAAAIGIGLVMVFGGKAPTNVVKIIAILLVLTGVASLIYGLIKSKENGVYQLLLVNAGLDLALGLLLFFNPQWIVGVIVYAIGIILILLGGLQLLVLAGAMSLLGAGFSSLILSICAIVGGAFLLFNPFAINVMSVIAGCFLLVYGVAEIISMFKMSKAKEEFEIRRTAAATNPNAPEIGSSDLTDAKEVSYEKVDEQEYQEDLD